MRKFIAQSCAFLGTFRHSHAPLSPHFSLSLAHLCCLDFVAYARWAYVAFVRRLCPAGIRRRLRYVLTIVARIRGASIRRLCPLGIRRRLRYVLTIVARIRSAGRAMCSLTLRAYARLFLRSSSHPLLSTNPIFSQLFSHFLLALPQWRSALLQCKCVSILNTKAKAIAAELGHKMK